MQALLTLLMSDKLDLSVTGEHRSVEEV